MSEYYITEPPTSGKVILETNYGNIDIELFTREAPKSCKNFIQHCLNKYYNGCIFFKIFKNFMIQTGDPTNTGNGGKSIFSEDFRDEFHSRLKFNHRGIVAMANKNKPNSNGSQFFITLDKCEDMNKKFTIFGKVTGPTYFNAVNISNLSSDEDGCPIMNDDEKPKIVNTEVVINPFSELKPTVIIQNDNNDEKNNKNKKNKKLKIKYTTDKMFFKDEEDNEDEKDNKNNEKSKNENNNKEKNDEIKEKSEENKNNNENKNEEDEESNNSEENKIDKKINNKEEDKDNNKEEENKEDNNKEEENEEDNDNEDKDEDNEDSESESKSLSSEDNIVQNAKQLLDNDEDNIPKNKKKNIDDYKKEINLLRKKVKRENEEQLNENELRKKIEEEKFNKMNILQKYNYDYVKSKQANKLSNDERANKLKNFKSYIGGGDSNGWYKTKLKFQTDSQKAFTLDMINKELEKNENNNE